MARRLVYEGDRFRITFAVLADGSCPAGTFFDGLSISDKAKLMALFQLFANHGPIANDEKFGVLKDGLYEFKSFQIRMPFGYAKNERGVVVVTHGFRKKKDKAPPQEIDRARRILREDEQVNKIRPMKASR